MTTASAEEALSHLRKLKPLGGWSVESKTSGAHRLLRRKIPITDSFFLDIHHDPKSGCIVGILSKSKNGKAQGLVIVNSDGSPAPTSKTEMITVSSYDTIKKTSTPATSRTAPPTSSTTNNNSNATTPVLSPEENKQLLQYAMYAFGVALFMKLLTQAINTVALLLIPVLYFYALQTIPSERDFDAKKELKRVLRGEHLPENHVDKPKGFFDQALSRIHATVTTELATGLGYEVSMMSIGGAAWFTGVKVPASSMEFFWLGAFGKWTYLYARKIE